MKYFLLFLQFFYFGNTLSQDSLSLNDKANIAILESIKKLPPTIKIQFFIDGKELKTGYEAYTICGKKIISKNNKNLLNLDLKDLKKGDSIIFLLKYKGKNIYSRKYNFQGFIHGGKYIVGILSDFYLERQKYLKDTSLYIIENRRNFLYHFITKKNEKEQNLTQRYQLIYSVVKNNFNAWNDYKYEFVTLSRVVNQRGRPL